MAIDMVRMLLELVIDVVEDAGAILLLLLIVGATFVLVRQGERIARLERRLDGLERRGGGDAVEGDSPPAARAVPGAIRAPAVHHPVPAPAPPVPPPTPPAPQPRSDAASAPRDRPADSAAAHAPTATRSPFADGAASPGFLARCLSGGNWLVRGGVLVLFLGVGFLLKFAADHALLPVPLRLAGVGLGGLALVALGVRLAPRRRAYALSLQGCGVGLLYLTLYAAYRLYALLPAGIAFVLMVAVVIAAGGLALRQNAQALAVLGAAGGFLAPVLASTGSGSHVSLFSYYALLNCGVLWLALRRLWRPLNLVGFAATFGLSALWGARFYHSAHFATVEPFLVMFFAMYLAVAVAFASLSSVRLRDPLDATLVFGTPLVAFGLQSRLLDGSALGLAGSAAALAVVYLALALSLRARPDPRRFEALVEAFLALAAGFLTLAVPLALDARWTAASWSLEGAALVWVGWRQRRLLARLAGAALQLLAGAAWVWHAASQTAWESGDWLGTLMLAAGGAISAAVLRAPRDAATAPRSDQRPLGVLLAIWGLGWWFAGGLAQVAHLLPSRHEIGGELLFLAASAVMLDLAARRLNWALPAAVAVSLPAALVLVAGVQAISADHPLTELALAGWPLAILAAGLVLYRQRGAHTRLQDASLVVLVWLLAGIAAWELAWWFQQLLPPIRSWQRLAWLLAPALGVAALAAHGARPRCWPFTTRASLLLGPGAGPVVSALAGGVFALSVADPDAPWPIPYVPLVNPLDLGLLATVAAGVWWARSATAVLGTALGNLLAVAGAGLGFVWLNGALLRTIHFWADVPYRFGPMFDSTLVQASVSVLWAATGLVTMVGASRTASRTLWGVGAALMAVVVVKLLLVDLASSGTIARIVSFISVGLLLMLVGYLAPVPPRTERAS